MAYTIKDFKDIQDFVMEELKLQRGDTVSRNRIKRDINAIYLHEIVPFKRWYWLNGHTSVKHNAYYYAGTVSVTPDSTSATLSVAPTTSKANMLFAVDAFTEIYSVSAHTANTTALTLNSVYEGTLDSEATYKIWSDTIALPVNFRESVEVYHEFASEPMRPLGLQEFRRMVARNPRQEGRPQYYTIYDFYDPSTGDDETESDRYRTMKVWPSISQYNTTIKVDYICDATALDLDGDEPLMPISDRIVIAYGALSRAWSRVGDANEAARNQGLYDRKLSQMAGRQEDGADKPQLVPNSEYVTNKRRGRTSRFGLSSRVSGTSNVSPTFLKDVTIEGANITDDVTVTSGKTIDGRDVSADGATLDALDTLIGGVDTANRVVITDASGNLDESAVTSSSLLFLQDSEAATSATLPDNTSSAAVVAQWAVSVYDSLFIMYTLKRGATNKKTGFLTITTDGTNVSVAGFGAAELGTLGVSFTGDLSGANIRLLYTTTSTGTDVDFIYKVHKWLG